MTKDLEQTGDFLFYTGPDGSPRIEVYFEDETVWLTQKKMSD
jgi:hypothetical protein